MAYLGGIHFWWPKMFGKMYNEAWAKASAILVFVGFNGTFFPQFIMGYMGSPRRYHIYPQEFQIFHILSTAGMVVLGAGYLLPMIYLPVSLFRGKKAPANPWGAFGLEWKTSSPPPTLNFDKTPTVTLEAYDYTSMKSEVTP
jgi:cytochrome c oxidase subunit 1